MQACCGSRPGAAKRGGSSGGSSGDSTPLLKRKKEGAAPPATPPPPPLVFTTTSDDLELSEGGAVVTRSGHTAGSNSTSLKEGRKLGGGGRPGAGSRYRCAMCGNEADVLEVGRHLVEFQLTRAAGNATIGVAQANYDPLKVYLPGEPRGEAGESWGMSTRSGSLSFRGQVNSWVGRKPAAEGDRVGMLIDMSNGSLTVFLNRVKLGIMVPSGLEGPLLWMTELSTAGDAVRIDRIEPLPAWAT